MTADSVKHADFSSVFSWHDHWSKCSKAFGWEGGGGEEVNAYLFLIVSQLSRKKSQAIWRPIGL